MRAYSSGRGKISRAAAAGRGRPAPPLPREGPTGGQDHLQRTHGAPQVARVDASAASGSKTARRACSPSGPISLSSFRAPGAARVRLDARDPAFDDGADVLPGPPTSRGRRLRALISSIASRAADWNCARLQVSSGVTRSIRWWGRGAVLPGRAWPCRYPCPGRTAASAETISPSRRSAIWMAASVPYSGGAEDDDEIFPSPPTPLPPGRGVLRK